MIFSRTILSVKDNSGARYVKAIAVWGNVYRPYGRLCDTMLVVPKKLKRKIKRTRSNIQKRKKYIGLILTTAWNTRRRDGTFIRFIKSSAILFTLKQKLLGTAIRAPLCREFKHLAEKEGGDYKKLTAKTRLYL